MVNLLTNYFLANRELLLPGIGQLQSVHLPARYDAARQQMLPPSESFNWQPDGEAGVSNQSFLGFLSRQKHWSEEESYEELTAFCNQVRGALNESGEWIWPGLGKLVKISEGNYGFVPDPVLNDYYRAIPAERVQHSNRPHPVKVGDRETNTVELQSELAEGLQVQGPTRWWLPALVIGILAVALIIARLTGLV